MRPVQISEYQRWLEQWDRTRGWHRGSLSRTMEELGEVTRPVLLVIKTRRRGKRKDSISYSSGAGGP